MIDLAEIGTPAPEVIAESSGFEGMSTTAIYDLAAEPGFQISDGLRAVLAERLGKLREAIDEDNVRIVAAVGERGLHSGEIGQIKAVLGNPGQDTTREREVLKTVADLARQQGLDPEHVQRMFTGIFEATKAAHGQKAMNLARERLKKARRQQGIGELTVSRAEAE